MDLIEIDDVIPKLYQDLIEAEAGRVPWYFDEESGRRAGLVETSYGGYSQLAFHTNEASGPLSPLTALLLPLLLMFCDRAKQPFSRLLRVRLGMFPKSAVEAPYHNPHVDFYQHHQSAIYYVNDADGDTVLFNETFEDVGQEQSIAYTRDRQFTIAQRVSPKKGRMIGFPGKRYHASMHPLKSASRIAIAFSWL